MPPPIGSIISARLATMHEMRTIYNTEDMYNFLEILNVDAENQKIMQRHAAKK